MELGHCAVRLQIRLLFRLICTEPCRLARFFSLDRKATIRNLRGSVVETRFGKPARQLFTCSAIFVLVASSLLAAPAWPQSLSDSKELNSTHPEIPLHFLDGRQFRVGIVQNSDADDSGDSSLNDVLRFKDGNFSSEICETYNFSESPYWVRVEGDQVHFLAELTSPTDGKMLWQGTIRGDALSGTMRWTKKRWYWTIDVEHEIRGQLEK